MKFKLVALLLLVLGAAWLPVRRTIGSSASQDFDPVTVARAYLADNAPAGISGSNAGRLALLEARQSPGAYHVRFQQTVDGLPIFGAYATVSIAKSTRDVTFALDRRASAGGVSAAGATIDQDAAIETAKQAIGLKEPRGHVTSKQIYVPRQGALALAWQVLVPSLQPFGDWLVVLSAERGEILLKQNVLRFDTGQVFDPNPVVTSGGGVPPPSDCDSAPNATSLSPQYRPKTLLGIQGGQGKLKGQYVDLTAPGIEGSLLPAGQADEPSHIYNYSCNDPRFEEVMAYYHIDSVQRKIQSLGFTGKSAILNRPISAHAHYDPGPPPPPPPGDPAYPDYACNAFFSSFDGGLHFGDFPGRCNDGFPTDVAEDADWIIHEYGHAIQDNQVPDFGVGGLFEQPAAMGEGFGDFLAAAITGNACWGEWENIGEIACDGQPGLRWLGNSLTYPVDYNACYIPELHLVEPHCAGEIWSGALWDLVEALGNDQAARDLTLTLVLDSHFYLDPIARFADGAAAIRQADEDLFGGAHSSTIASVFNARGISAGGPIGDVPYVYVRIRHPFFGDLEVHLVVGNPVSPLCSYLIVEPDPLDDTEAIPFSFPLDGESCNSFLPPSPSRPWRLKVQDQVSNDVGTIEEFQVALSGTQRCEAADVPLFIPDNGSPVYSVVDCSTTAQALPTTQPATATATQALVPTDTPTATPTFTPTHTPTNAPTHTPTRTATRTRTPTRTPSRTYGDVSCDGRVDSIDSALVLQYDAGLIHTLDCPQNGDVNGNGRTDSIDALLILQFVAGLIPSL